MYKDSCCFYTDTPLFLGLVSPSLPPLPSCPQLCFPSQELPSFSDLSFTSSTNPWASSFPPVGLGKELEQGEFVPKCLSSHLPALFGWIVSVSFLLLERGSIDSKSFKEKWSCFFWKAPETNTPSLGCVPGGCLRGGLELGSLGWRVLSSWTSWVPREPQGPDFPFQGPSSRWCL